MTELVLAIHLNLIQFNSKTLYLWFEEVAYHQTWRIRHPNQENLPHKQLFHRKWLLTVILWKGIFIHYDYCWDLIRLLDNYIRIIL